MSTSILNLNFLEELNKKTVQYYDSQITPNITGKTVIIQMARFTKYPISKADFKRVLDIIKEELLLILPQENLMGSIDGYLIFDLRGKILLRFGESNLPDSYTLKSIFPYCQTEENKDILALLSDEEILTATVKKTFEEYCY